jgi:hypothetical protein
MDWSKLLYTNKYTVQQLENALQNIQDTTEVEIRLGNFLGSNFTSHIDTERYKHIEQTLQAYSNWDSTTQARSVDYFYTHQGTPIRTTTTTNNGKLQVVHQQKTKGVNLVIPLSSIDVRVSIKEELPVVEVPDCANTTLVRIKERHSFAKNNWRYDFTLVRQATTYALAEIANVHHEIEIECLCPVSIVEQYNHQYLAVDCLCKIHTLFPDDQITLS